MCVLFYYILIWTMFMNVLEKAMWWNVRQSNWFWVYNNYYKRLPHTQDQKSSFSSNHFSVTNTKQCSYTVKACGEVIKLYILTTKDQLLTDISVRWERGWIVCLYWKDNGIIISQKKDIRMWNEVLLYGVAMGFVTFLLW